jgi:hypothetical protein
MPGLPASTFSVSSYAKNISSSSMDPTKNESRNRSDNEDDLDLGELRGYRPEDGVFSTVDVDNIIEGKEISPQTSEGYTATEERIVIRKLDRNVVFFPTLLGMITLLDVTSKRYSTLLSF